MEQKNFFLAMGLIVGFLIVWTVFVIPRFTPPPPTPSASQSTEAAVETASSSGNLPSKQDKKDKPVVLTDSVLRDEDNEITLSPKGGAVKSWHLKSKLGEIELVCDSDRVVCGLHRAGSIAQGQTECIEPHREQRE